MSYLDLTIVELHKAIIEKKVTSLELVQEALQRAREDTNNAFEYILEREALEKVKNLDYSKIDNPFFGIPVVIKDNYSLKGVVTTAGSNILNDYVPVFSAEVCQRLEDSGAIIIGKATLDELAMGGTGTTGHKGISYNPWDEKHEHLIGGSSCGSAIAVASSIVPFSLGSDTGDSVRKPASYAGLVGFKPSWGRISRYGLFPFAVSLDHVAYFTRSVMDSALSLNLLAGRDDKDSSSSFKDVIDYTLHLNDSIKGKKIALIKEIINSISDETILKTFNKTLEYLKSEGAIVEYVSFNIDLLKAIYPTYIVISSAEATSNNANLDGIKFGPRSEGNTYEEVMLNSRTKGFGELIKRRFVIGSFSLLSENQHELFLRAQKCRRLIVNETNRILKEYDVIYCPASPTVAPSIHSGVSNKLSLEYLIADNYLAIANMGGLPSITIPIGFKDNLPFGGNLTSKAFEEGTVLNIANILEKHTGYYNLLTKGGKK